MNWITRYRWIGLLVLLNMAGHGLADDKKPEPAKNRPYHEINADLKKALREEAKSKTLAEKQPAVLQLTELFIELTLDERTDESRKLSEFRGKSRSRLLKIQKSLQAQQRRRSKVGFRNQQAALPGGNNGGRQQIGNNHADALIELIQATISPDSWDVNGGNATIRYYAPLYALVVSAPSHVHIDVGRVLNDVRNAGP